MEFCIICRSDADKNDRYYIRSNTQTAIKALLVKLPSYLAKLFDLHPSHVSAIGPKDPFCCRQCKRLLEKRQKLSDSVANTEAELRERRNTKCSRSLFTADASADETSPDASVPSGPDCVGPLHSTPLASRHSEGRAPWTLQPDASPVIATTSVLGTNDGSAEAKRLKTHELGVKVVVSWPSQTKHRKLRVELEPLGKALLRGTWKEIARAAFRVTQIRAELLKLCLKEVSKECSNLVSPKHPSVLRKVSAMDMENLTLKKVCM